MKLVVSYRIISGFTSGRTEIDGAIVYSNVRPETFSKDFPFFQLELGKITSAFVYVGSINHSKKEVLWAIDLARTIGGEKVTLVHCGCDRSDFLRMKGNGVKVLISCDCGRTRDGLGDIAIESLLSSIKNRAEAMRLLSGFGCGNMTLAKVLEHSHTLEECLGVAMWGDIEVNSPVRARAIKKAESLARHGFFRGLLDRRRIHECVKQLLPKYNTHKERTCAINSNAIRLLSPPF